MSKGRQDLNVIAFPTELLSCLRNVVTLFHIIQREMAWRESQGNPGGFETLRNHKPIVAVGADQPLEDQLVIADYYRILNVFRQLLRTDKF